MKLFYKEKDLIFKITNLVLIMWLMGAMMAFWISITNVLLPTKIPTYKHYVETNCSYNYRVTPGIEEDSTMPPVYTDKDCRRAYDSQVSYLEDIRYEQKKDVFIALGNIIIVSAVLYILNGKKA